MIASDKDTAGLNIKDNLLSLYKWESKGVFHSHPFYEFKDSKNELYLFTSNKESIFCENVDLEIEQEIGKFDLLLFTTKHAAKSGIPSLSVHTQGNWAKAEFGGKDRTLAIAPARLLKTFFVKLENNATGMDYDIIQECTHHGPYVKCPSIFIEIGSLPEQWKDKKAGMIIAQTIKDVFEGRILQDRVAVGIGGMHHTPIFRKVMQRNDIAFGHVCPKYMLEKLDKDMIRQAISQTQEEVNFVALDWKGLGSHKEAIVKMLEELDLKYEKYRFN